MPSCFGSDIKHACSTTNETAQGHTGVPDIQGTGHLSSSDRRIWIRMDTYGAWIASDEDHIIIFWVLLGVPDLVRTVVCHVQSAAPDCPAVISNNQGACLLLRVLLFGQSSAFPAQVGCFDEG